MLVLQLLLNYAKSGGDKSSQPIAVFGRENMSVQLPCRPSHADTPRRVEWLDLAYNMIPEPIRIFDSPNITNHLHPNRHNYEVSGLLDSSMLREVTVCAATLDNIRS